MRALLALPVWFCLSVASAGTTERVLLAGLQRPVEVLRDRWGVPHIYAKTVDDLFFVQGYMAARDRLWQLDMWRRVGSGELAEVLGPSAVERDRMARLVRFRGDLQREWASYGPNGKRIITAFANGVNAYIRSLNGRRPTEFQMAGYGPGLWEPEDCLSRMAGLSMTRNLTREVRRTEDVRAFGRAAVEKFMPPEPFIGLEMPKGLDASRISVEIMRHYNAALGQVRFPEEHGSNNWVIDGKKSATGRPILASDPHRQISIPSLRRAVHLVGPGWNVIGAGEPALPGIALGHNESIAFGFTIVGIDQQDLYVEKLDSRDPNQYWYRGAWRKVETERQRIKVKGLAKPEEIVLRFTVHGPVIAEDREHNTAYAMRWAGSEPGTAGYLAGLVLAQAKNWPQFRRALELWKLPAENVIYADRFGNIGWQVAGLTPIRTNWSGLFPVPGDKGEYEWAGFRSLDELPHSFNPPSHFIATANQDILPPGYSIPIGYEWSPPFRFQRIQEVLSQPRKFDLYDFRNLQQDLESIPGRRFQAAIRKWHPTQPQLVSALRRISRWDAKVTADSIPATIFEVWTARLPRALFGPGAGERANLEMVLQALESRPDARALARSLQDALDELEERLGADVENWKWGRLHQVMMRHALNVPAFNRGPLSRPGDWNTVNATGGSNYRQESGATYRQICDLSNWDRSVMTNAPGETGDPNSPHYADLLREWESGGYHPMPYTRKAVLAATVERIVLLPVRR